MTIPTSYVTLQAAVLDWAWGRNTAQVTTAIQLAHTEINLGLRVPFMQKTASLTINANRIAAPTDMAAPVRLWIDGNDDSPLQPTAPDRVIAMRAQFSSSQPLVYAIEGDTTTGSENTTEGEYFTFGPSPGTTTYTGYLLYIRRLAALSADGDTNIVLDRYPNLYLWGALAAMSSFEDEDGRYAKFVPQFGSLLARINEQARSDSYAGGALSMTSPYMVGQL